MSRIYQFFFWLMNFSFWHSYHYCARKFPFVNSKIYLFISSIIYLSVQFFSLPILSSVSISISMVLSSKNLNTYSLKASDNLYKHPDYFACVGYCSYAAQNTESRQHLPWKLYLLTWLPPKRLTTVDYFALRLQNHYNWNTKCNQSVSYL